MWRFRPRRFAYLFERFPSFTQTFCLREVEEMYRQGICPPLFSIRNSDEDAPQISAEINVKYLPPDEVLTSQIRELQSLRKLPRAMNHCLRDWSGSLDKHRVYAAAWLGPVLRAQKIRHVHAHFAGMAARTAFWLKKFYGISYSFTGHANDLFVENDLPVTLQDLIRDAESIITETDFSRDWLKRKYPAHRKKIHRIYNGIPLEKYSTDPGRKSGRRILSVGRLIEKKGFADLIEACLLLKTRNVAFTCSIVGSGPLEEKLRAQIDVAELTDRVLLLGPKSQEEIIQLLAGADLFVLPCVEEAGGGMDNLPTVIMEAMAASLPVISTATAGIPEMVIDGVTGSLVPQNSPAKLAEAIIGFLDQPAIAQEFGTRAREAVAEKFPIEKSVSQLRNFIQ
jgi:colanic acid/amylovoran biosynthesis glycosyltransferase